MRILGHVKYPAKPVDVRASKPGPKPIPTPEPDAVFDWLKGIAERGEAAPQLSEIQDKWGSRGDAVMRDLVEANRIIIEVGGRNWRVIRIVGTELHTMTREPWRPYRMVDHNGSWWRSADGKRWEQRP